MSPGHHPRGQDRREAAHEGRFGGRAGGLVPVEQGAGLSHLRRGDESDGHADAADHGERLVGRGRPARQGLRQGAGHVEQALDQVLPGAAIHSGAAQPASGCQAAVRILPAAASGSGPQEGGLGLRD
eukprot:scaffold748_cov251-Pinguiococcus_pyrenoidosus.AAC.21